MHLTYLGNLLLCVWSNPACFSEVYVRRLEIVQWAWCVWLYVCVCVQECYRLSGTDGFDFVCAYWGEGCEWEVTVLCVRVCVL